jgi:hypothetical protein
MLAPQKGRLVVKFCGEPAFRAYVWLSQTAAPELRKNAMLDTVEDDG